MTKINSSNSVMLLATRFADRGDWTVEQQFVLQMGSSYLLAHGIGSPLAKDAVTTFEIAEEGDYRLLVRTKNWTAFWSDGKTPGVFQIKIDAQTDAAEFGLGCDGATRARYRNGWKPEPLTDERLSLSFVARLTAIQKSPMIIFPAHTLNARTKYIP